MNTENITLKTIESDIERLKRDISVLLKNVKGDNKLFRRTLVAEDQVHYRHDISAEVEYILLMVKEMSYSISLDFKLKNERDKSDSREIPIEFENEDFLEYGVPGAFIAEALSSLPKLSDDAIDAIESGSNEMRKMKMPDSAWD